ncbi:uncharacterized protein UHOD_11280 [Ustilago sp. UG-2017b]|nr:uncharacterized protein UHOD_11280 [Ustilago sp. UG-2017b]
MTAGWRSVARHDQYQYEGDGEVGGVDDDTKVWLDYCLRFYLNPDRWSAMNRLRTSLYVSPATLLLALSPESTFFVEYCTGGPSSTTPVLLELCVSSSDTAPPPYYPACLAPLCLLSCFDPFDTAPPPQDLFAGLLYTTPPPQDLLTGLLYTDPPPSTGDGSFDSCLSSP